MVNEAELFYALHQVIDLEKYAPCSAPKILV